MQLHDLKPSPGAHRRPERIGRGTGSGRGKTSGRGQKGQNARSEGFRVGFEGGQMPLSQRIPKLPGFKNPFHKLYAPVNLSKLSRFADGSKVDVEAFIAAGLVHAGEEIKVLGTGGLKRKLTVEAHAFSTSAREAIEKAGGSVKVLGEPRKIGARRLAAKTSKRAPKPDEADSSPRSGEVAGEAGGRGRAGGSRVKKGDAKAAVEEATPPDES
jgi:large subunit ribosomal protein L15